MENSNLISLLKTFSKKEIKEFDKFLRSPYFTEGKNIRHKILYDHFLNLKEYYPEFSDRQFGKEFMFQKLYPGKKFSDVTLRKLNSDLYKLAEKFLIQLELEKSEFTRNKLLLTQLTHRKNIKLHTRNFKRQLAYLNTLYKDDQFYYETYDTLKDHWNFSFSNRSLNKISQPVRSLDNYFISVILTSLGLYLWSLSFLRSPAARNEFYLFDEIMQHIKDQYDYYLDIPLVLFRYNLILLFTKKEESHFIELKKLKNKYFSSLSDLDKYNIVIMMTNFCNALTLNGNITYRRERYELDKELLSKRLFEFTGGLHMFSFLAIAKNANRLGKYKWTEEMTERYAGSLPLRDKEYALNYVKADICFMKKDYDTALKHLSKIRTEYSNEKQFTRNLILQIYYEMNENQGALGIIDSSRHFLHRDKHIDPSTKENSFKFIILTEQLIRAREKSNKDIIYQLRKSLNSAENIQNKDWLFEKMDELEKIYEK